LGNLFRNKSFTDGKTELVILITPTEVVDPEAGENGKLIDRSKEILQEFSTLKESLVR
jgi:type II secretory pathway component GspD/PulD (secretin)